MAAAERGALPGKIRWFKGKREELTKSEPFLDRKV